MGENKTIEVECVVLLHGLARTPRSMRVMGRTLQASGYLVVNQAYPSTRMPIAELAEYTLSEALQHCRANHCHTIHFVTHSLGGILLRQFCRSHPIPGLGRVVMLGPPNHGSEVADHLRHLAPYRWLNGPAGLELGTDRTSVPSQLGPVEFDLGVIAGTRSINLLLSRLLPNPNDGKVSVESAKVEGMRDFIALPVNHTFMMRDRRAIGQTLHFLQHGCFDHLSS